MNRACFEWRIPPAPPPSRLDQLTLGMMRLAYVIYGALLAGMVAIVIVIAHNEMARGVVARTAAGAVADMGFDGLALHAPIRRWAPVAG